MNVTYSYREVEIVKKQTENRGRLCLFIIVLLMLVGSAAAITVTETPSAIYPGNRIQIEITGMTDGQTFTTEIYDAVVTVNPDSGFTFSISDYYFPFSLNSAQLTVQASPVQNLRLSVRRPDDTIIQKQVGATGGVATITADVGTQLAGSYDITLSGQALTTSNVNIDMSLTGTTAGTSSVMKTGFIVQGVEQATIPVRTTIDAVDYLDTIVRVIPVPTGGGGSGGGGTSSGGVAVSDTGLVEDTFSATSSDGIASLTIPEGSTALTSDGQPLESVAITRVSTGSVPSPEEGSVFEFAGYAYQCSPTGAVFSPPAQLVFSFTAEEWAALDTSAMMVRWYNSMTGMWESVPTVVDPITMTVTAQVSHFSLFALFHYAQPTTTTSVTMTMPAITTAAPAGTTAPPATPAPAEFPWIYVLGALIVIVIVIAVFFMLQKK